ncbi:hypothetical protein ACFOW1_01880 [Parasediminibacterium paludis]|uniref:Uncharacterized protein n=1 Tax=Parasediminibacterium paludis TaxID=908966 RepID=A0ABV8PRI4_9BACT
MIITGDNGETIEICNLGRLYPQSTEEAEADLMKCKVNVNLQGFAASFSFHSRKSELNYWKQALQGILNQETKDVHLSTLEGDISLFLQVDLLGRLYCFANFVYPVESANKLSFKMCINDINSFIIGLNEIIE